MSDAPDLRSLRPWYLLVAMILVWIIGVMGATSSCSELGFMRGDEEVRNAFEEQMARAELPLARTELVRQHARLEAMGEHHHLAFPVSLAKTLLQLLLVVAAGAVITGRRGARTLALQALGANIGFVIVAFLALTPVRQAASEAAAREGLALGRAPAEMDEAQAMAFLRQEQRQLAVARAGFEASLYVLAIFFLTRPRARTYFNAIEGPLGDPEEG